MEDRNLFLNLTPIIPKVGSGQTSRFTIDRLSRKFSGDYSKTAFTNSRVSSKHSRPVNVAINNTGNSNMDLRTANNYLNALQQGVETASDIADNVIKVVNVIKGDSSSGGSSVSGGNRSTYGFKDIPPSIETKLETGLDPTGYVDIVHDAMENGCSPCHLTAGILEISTDTTLRINDYFNKVLAFMMQAKTQKSVSFDVRIDTILTPTNLLAAMNSLLWALQVYYYYNSILAFGQLPANQNMGMTNLRGQLTPDILNAYQMLYERLMDTPIPPKMLSIVRYLATNYTTGVAESSQIIKFVPHGIDETSQVSLVSIQTALTNLTTGSTPQVFGLLTRALPGWTTHSLASIPITPIYDRDFATAWSNAPFITTLGGTFPTASTVDSEMMYCSFSNDLDGFISALATVYTGSKYQPPLWKPIGSAGKPSRLSFYEVGGTKKFYNSIAYPFLQATRNEVHRVDSTTALVESHFHIYGTERVRGVSANSITSKAQAALDILLSISDIMTSGPKKTGFSRSSGKSGGKGRGKGKDKSKPTSDK